MTKLRTTPLRIPSWTRGVIEGMDASVAPVGSLASALNFIPTPAERLAVRGGSAVVQTLHDDAGTPPTVYEADTFVDEGSGTILPSHTPSGPHPDFFWDDSDIPGWGGAFYIDGADPDHPNSALLPVSPGWGGAVTAAVNLAWPFDDLPTPNYRVAVEMGFPTALYRNVALGLLSRTDENDFNDGTLGYRAELQVSGAYVGNVTIDTDDCTIPPMVTDLLGRNWATASQSGAPDSIVPGLGLLSDADSYVSGVGGTRPSSVWRINYGDVLASAGSFGVEGTFAFGGNAPPGGNPTYLVLSMVFGLGAPLGEGRLELKLQNTGAVELREYDPDGTAPLWSTPAHGYSQQATATPTIGLTGTFTLQCNRDTCLVEGVVNGVVVASLTSTYLTTQLTVPSVSTRMDMCWASNARDGATLSYLTAVRVFTLTTRAGSAHPDIVLSKVDGLGVATELDRVDGVALTADVTHTVALDCGGSTIRVLVDGVEQLSVVDTTYAGPGLPGLYGTKNADGNGDGGTAWMDDFSVETIDTELATTLRLDPFTAVGMVAVGWSSGESKHYLYRLTPNAAFFTGTESTSRTDLTASPSTGWNVGPRRPFSVELFSKLFLLDCTPVFTDRQPMVTIDAGGTLLEPLYALSGAIAATTVLTSDGTKPTANDTVTIGSVTYTFKATVGVTANQVLIGVSALTALSNLVDAVNLAPGGAAINYGSATVVNPDASGAITTALKATFTALAGGVGGNSLPSTEASSHLSFASATFTGGAGSTPSPLKPLCAEEYNNVLFVAGYGDEGGQDVPNLIRHSFLGQDPGNPATGFDPLAYNHIGADGVPILALKKGRGILLVFKVNEIWRITGFGNASPGWQYQVELVNNTFGYGVSNPWAVTFAEDYWYGWGLNGPFRTDGYTVESLRGPREVSWRLLDQFDRYWVEYHPDRRVVCFGVHPAQTSGSRSASVPWDVWNWDLARSVWTADWEFGQSLHSPDFGAGYDLNHVKAINTTTVTGPTAPPVIAAVSSVNYHTFTANWANGDTSAQTEVWVSQAAGPFTLFGTAAAGAISLPITGWVSGNAYTVKVRHTKAGVVTAFSATVGWSATGSPPTAITGATAVGYGAVEYGEDQDGNPVLIAPAFVNFVVVEALDTLDLYQDGGVLQTWTNVAAGTVVNGFELPVAGFPPVTSVFHFHAVRANYTFIDTADVSIPC